MAQLPWRRLRKKTIVAEVMAAESVAATEISQTAMTVGLMAELTAATMTTVWTVEEAGKAMAAKE